MRFPRTPQPKINMIFLSLLSLLLLRLAGTASVQAQPFAYVTNQGDHNVSVINTATNTEVDVDENPGNGITRIPVGNVPTGVGVTPDGAFVYMTNFTSANVSVID